MKICPQCQAENRDTANFCVVCRAALALVRPAAQNAPVSPPGATVAGPPPVLLPPAGQVSASQWPKVPPPPAVRPMPKPGWSFWHGRVQAEGRVSAVDPVREMPLPFDAGRTLVLISAGLIGLGLLASFAMVAALAAIVLLLLGIGGLCVMPVILPVVGVALYPVIAALRGRRQAPMVELRLEDEWTGQPVSVVLFLGYGSSNVRLGDRVRVYGSRSMFQHTIRACHIDVTESNNQPVAYGIDGLRPWPLWVGLISLGLVVVGYWWLFSGGQLLLLGG